MSGLLQLLRASLLGACLCIAAAQLGHVETRSAGLAQSGQQLARGGVQSGVQSRVQSQWKASLPSDCAACAPSAPAPSDSQTPGDLGSIGSDADDADDFDDASLHAHLSLFCLDFGVVASVRGGQRERVRARLEDRRRAKPPRPRVV
jgi:hypothetical protein